MLVPLLLSVRPHATPRSAARQLLMCSDKPDGETFNVDVDSFYKNKGLPWNKDPDDDSEFNPEGGPLRRQILENESIFLPMEGYRWARPIMRKAFAAASPSKSDNGWLSSLDEFRELMQSVGEQLSEDDYDRLYGMCLELPTSFNGQPKGTVTLEQWVNVMLRTKDEAKDPNKKAFFGLF